MIKKFRIFDKNILFEADFELKATGSSALFCYDFDDADVTCRVYQSKSLNNTRKATILDTPDFSVRQIGSDFVRTTHDAASGRELARAIMKMKEQKIELYVTKEYSDCFYFWPFLRFDSFLRDTGIVMLHASYIVNQDGKAILFTAPSGGGKSTQAELWRKYKNARIINGDKAVLKVREDGKVYAYSLPICGTSGICLNETHEVLCIVVLSQSKHNTLQCLDGNSSLQALISTAFTDYWDSSDLIKCLSILKDISQKTTVCSLACLPDSSACDCLEHFLEGKI